MSTRPVSPTYRGLVLAMLLVVYTFNFVDRQILAILVQPIKADLKLTDAQLGALGGIAFALLYSTLAVPLALLADRTSRTWIITIALTVWSGFTALCGVATSFLHLFLFRLGVGVGEAGGVAPSYALIADYFEPRLRSRALAIYSLGIPLGAAAGAILGGYIAAAVDWRTAFIVVGVCGVAIAPIFRIVVREPVRARMETIGADRSPTPIGAVFGILGKKSSFWLMSVAAALSSLCGQGLAFWMPALLVRSFGFDLVTTSQYIGSLFLVGGVAGVLAGGWLADRLGPGEHGWYARLPAIAWLVTAPLLGAGLLSPSPTISWCLFVIPFGLNLLWLGPVTAAVQQLAPENMRATASASFLFIVNLIGIGFGSWVMGAMSDGLIARYGTDALRYATVISLGFYVLAAVLMFFAIRPLRRQWHA